LNAIHAEVPFAVIDIISIVADKFCAKPGFDHSNFSLRLTDTSQLFVNPRQYSQIFSEGSINVDRHFDSILEVSTELDLPTVDADLRATLFESFSAVLRTVFMLEFGSPKSGDAFLENLRIWFLTTTELSLIEHLTKFEGAKSKLNLVLSEILQDTSQPLADNIELTNTLKNLLSQIDITSFKQDIHNFFDQELHNRGITEFVEKKYPNRVYVDNELKVADSFIRINVLNAGSGFTQPPVFKFSGEWSPFVPEVIASVRIKAGDKTGYIHINENFIGPFCTLGQVKFSSKGDGTDLKCKIETREEGVTLVTYIIKELALSIKENELSGDLIEIVKDLCFEYLQKLVERDISKEDLKTIADDLSSKLGI
jgi:hypothetical protein